MKSLTMLAVLVFALGACDQKDATKPATSSSSKTADTKSSSGKDAKDTKGKEKPMGDTKPASAEMSDGDVDSAEIPVPEDYEEEAEKKITKDSLDAEVKRLEKEINEDE